MITYNICFECLRFFKDESLISDGQRMKDSHQLIKIKNKKSTKRPLTLKK